MIPFCATLFIISVTTASERSDPHILCPGSPVPLLSATSLIDIHTLYIYSLSTQFHTQSHMIAPSIMFTIQHENHTGTAPQQNNCTLLPLRTVIYCLYSHYPYREGSSKASPCNICHHFLKNCHYKQLSHLQEPFISLCSFIKLFWKGAPMPQLALNLTLPHSAGCSSDRTWEYFHS